MHALRNSALIVSFVTALSGHALASDDAPISSETVAVVAAPAAEDGVAGMIKLKGDAPAPEKVDISSDPVCDGLHPDGFKPAVIRGSGGGLADVFVQLTDGVPDERRKAPKEPVVLDQVGCTYIPHVFGMMKKQDLKILNSDDTLHNIHPSPKVNREFNVGMPNKGMEITQTFKKAEDAVVIKCDVHPWMTAYAFVLEHPYYGVTDEKGKFHIDTTDLEDGEYGVKLWHESLGTKEGKLTLAEGKASYEFTFEL